MLQARRRSPPAPRRRGRRLAPPRPRPRAAPPSEPHAWPQKARSSHPAAAWPTAMPPPSTPTRTTATRSTRWSRNGNPRPPDRRQRRLPPPARIPADRRATGGRKPRSPCWKQQGFGKPVPRLRRRRRHQPPPARPARHRPRLRHPGGRSAAASSPRRSPRPTRSNDVQRQQLRARLIEAGYGNVNIDESVEPDLLGGLVVRIGARLYDTSLKSRLQRLQYAMKGAA